MVRPLDLGAAALLGRHGGQLLTGSTAYRATGMLDRALGYEELVAETTALVKTKMLTTASTDTEHDLLSGTAGAVVALLRLADLLALRGCVEAAQAGPTRRVIRRR